MRSKILATLFILLWSFSVPAANAAFDYRYDSKDATKGQFESSITAKLTRGVTNTLFGWTEIMNTPVQMAAGIEHGALYSTVFGLPLGVFRFVGRTLVGVYEVATCYAPQAPIMKELQGPVE